MKQGLWIIVFIFASVSCCGHDLQPLCFLALHRQGVGPCTWVWCVRDRGHAFELSGDPTYGTITLVPPDDPAATYTLDQDLAKTASPQFAGLVLTEQSPGADTVTVRAPASLGASWTFTLPATAGAAGSFLANDGAGGTSWVAAPGIVDGTGSVSIGKPVAGEGTCYIAGIREVTTENADALAVVVDSSGQLGTVSSSQRFKDKITTVTEDNTRFAKLRPVSFIIKSDQKQKLQYGLIAEEVAELYPELVVYDAKGLPYTIMYQLFDGIFVHEIQRTEAQVVELVQVVAMLASMIGTLQTQVAALQKSVESLQKQKPKDTEIVVALRSSVY
jgi:hypothetical protein